MYYHRWLWRLSSPGFRRKQKSQKFQQDECKWNRCQLKPLQARAMRDRIENFRKMTQPGNVLKASTSIQSLAVTIIRLFKLWSLFTAVLNQSHIRSLQLKRLFDQFFNSGSKLKVHCNCSHFNSPFHLFSGMHTLATSLRCCPYVIANEVQTQIRNNQIKHVSSNQNYVNNYTPLKKSIAYSMKTPKELFLCFIWNQLYMSPSMCK